MLPRTRALTPFCSAVQSSWRGSYVSGAFSSDLSEQRAGIRYVLGVDGRCLPAFFLVLEERSNAARRITSEPMYDSMREYQRHVQY
eukprot:360076-Chlamydomonas_euryale.AAC.5